MGKQINYYMGYQPFLFLAKAALDSGCVVYRHAFEHGHWVLTAGTTIGIVVPECRHYYFHLPEMGEIKINVLEGNQHISHASQAYVIEAGFSSYSQKQRQITSSRLYVMTGQYAPDGEWIQRTEALTKVYNKLVRIAKKLAPYGEIAYYCANPLYADQKMVHKKYITPEYRLLVEHEDYKLL